MSDTNTTNGNGNGNVPQLTTSHLLGALRVYQENDDLQVSPEELREHKERARDRTLGEIKDGSIGENDDLHIIADWLAVQRAAEFITGNEMAIVHTDVLDSNPIQHMMFHQLDTVVANALLSAVALSMQTLLVAANARDGVGRFSLDDLYKAGQEFREDADKIRQQMRRNLDGPLEYDLPLNSECSAERRAVIEAALADGPGDPAQFDPELVHGDPLLSDMERQFQDDDKDDKDAKEGS